MAISKAMTLNDFRRYLAKLKNNLIGSDGAAVKGIHSGVMRAVTVVQARVDTAPPASPNGKTGAFDTGHYKRGWQFELLPRGGRIYNTSGAKAPVIEDGRRRGAARPPVREIELWARRRLGLSAEEAKSASFAIANAIAKRGLRGRKVLKSSTSEITRVVMEEIHREVKAALKAGGHIK